MPTLQRKLSLILQSNKEPFQRLPRERSPSRKSDKLLTKLFVLLHTKTYIPQRILQREFVPVFDIFQKKRINVAA